MPDNLPDFAYLKDIGSRALALGRDDLVARFKQIITEIQHAVATNAPTQEWDSTIDLQYELGVLASRIRRQPPIRHETVKTNESELWTVVLDNPHGGPVLTMPVAVVAKRDSMAGMRVALTPQAKYEAAARLHAWSLAIDGLASSNYRDGEADPTAIGLAHFERAHLLAMGRLWFFTSEHVDGGIDPKPAISAREQALALAIENPHLSDSEIAIRVGVSRTTLYDWPNFTALRAAQREQARGKIPRGSKSKDGAIEATDDE